MKSTTTIKTMARRIPFSTTSYTEYNQFTLEELLISLNNQVNTTTFMYDLNNINEEYQSLQEPLTITFLKDISHLK